MLQLSRKTAMAMLLLASTVLLSGCSFPTTNSAALQVSAKPDASVFLDGKHLGKTPYYSDQLKAGTYTLKISASEASYIEKVTLKSGSLTVVSRELNDNPLAQSGEVLWLEEGKGIFVSSSPPSADVVIDGNLKGKTPLLLNQIEEGEHKVLLSHDSYQDLEFSIKTSKKNRLIANVVLASDIAKSSKIEKTETQQSPQLEILKTPQGFLRVRREPALDAPEVGRVNTGDKFDIIQETEDWIKISFEGKLGWISAQYTKKI